MGTGIWKNPVNSRTRLIFVLAFNPAHRVLDVPGVNTQLNKIQMPDVVLFDALSRPEFGPIAERVRAGEEVTTEVGNRKISVVGLFEVGTSFGIDGTLVTSDLNFLRLLPMRDAIDSELPEDVLVLTKQGYIDREIAYWDSSTPIGYALTFGVIVGLVVGGIVVYQILFSDVTNHLAEYATLRAMGYPMSFLVGVVLQEAVILSLLGYVPATGISLGLYRMASDATRLPIEMSVERGVAVLGLTIMMCAISGLIAVRKLRTADPAEIF
jgi:putative ABC transport system permease protein